MIEIINDDVKLWSEKYTGPQFHALLCDPPYHLTSITRRFGKNGSAPAKYGTDGVFQRTSRGFMGQEWDGGDTAFDPETWARFMPLLHPGAFGMAFSAARGWHRLAVAIEDAGFIIHPNIFGWVQSQGFPHATRIDNQIDRDAGKLDEREIIGNKKLWGHNAGSGAGSFSKNQYEGHTGETRFEPITEPATDLAKAWQGHRYGAGALKPAIEPIILFQKPYEGRPLDNIVQTGAGALNIDGCRIESDEPYQINTWDDGSKPFGGGAGHEFTGRDEAARWPANFYLDETTAPLLDAQTGNHKGSYCPKPSEAKQGNIITGSHQTNRGARGYNDNGGASKFFYVVQDQIDNADPVFYCSKVMPAERYAGNIQNDHATLKPLSLCKYLATLLLPPALYAPRRLFVPFAGAGSEMIGAYQVGWEDVTGIEKMAGYCDIGRQRLAYYMGETLPLFQNITKRTA